MTDRESERRAIAEKIHQRPHRYVVCCGCFSVLGRKPLDNKPQRTCWNCAAYRFDQTVGDVLKAVDAALVSEYVPTYD